MIDYNGFIIVNKISKNINLSIGIYGVFVIEGNEHKLQIVQTIINQFAVPNKLLLEIDMELIT